MIITRLSFHNVLRFEDIDFSPGRFNVIRGRNEAGKTSFLSALRSALGGGHDGQLLRHGATEGEVVLILDDGEATISKTIKADSSPLKLSLKETGPIGKAQTWIDARLDRLSINPIDFIEAKTADQRIKWVLETLPLSVSEEQLTAAVGPASRAPAEEYGFPRLTALHALAAINQLEKQITEQRRDVNSVLKEKQSTVRQLKATAPPLPDLAVDPAEGLKAAIAQQEATRKYFDDELDSMKAAQRRERTAIGSAYAEVEKQANAAYQEAVNKAAAIRDEAVRAARQTLEEDTGAANEAFDQRRQVLEAERGPKLEAAQAQVEQARTIVQQSARALEAKRFIDEHSANLETLGMRSANYSAALDRLEQLRNELIKQTPSGVDIRDGELFVGGTAWQHVNTATKIKLALELAEIRAKDIGVICIDGAERLDENTFAEFEKQAKETKLQYFVARVTTGDLQLEAKP